MRDHVAAALRKQVGVSENRVRPNRSKPIEPSMFEWRGGEYELDVMRLEYAQKVGYPIFEVFHNGVLTEVVYNESQARKEYRDLAKFGGVREVFQRGKTGKWPVFFA